MLGYWLRGDRFVLTGCIGCWDELCNYFLGVRGWGGGCCGLMGWSRCW